MKFKSLTLIAAIICLGVSVLNSAPTTKKVKTTRVDRIYLTGDSGVQKSSKWAISNFWEKTLFLKVDDTSRINSDSCGFNAIIWGWTRNATTGWSRIQQVDSFRVVGRFSSRLFGTAHDTLSNAVQTIVDTSIVIADSTTSALADGRMDAIQISIIPGADTIQIYFYKNDWTKKASALEILPRLNQINPKNWQN